MLLLLGRISLAFKSKRFHSIQVDVLKVRQKWVCLQILLLVIVLLLIHWLPLKIVEITDSVLGNKPLLLQVSNYFFEVKILISQAVNLLMQVINRRLILS